jgi:hypothetical protein
MSGAGRNVLVLGAQGVLGSMVARAFADEGWRVVRAGRRPEVSEGFTLVDLDRPDTLRVALDGIDLVANPVPDERLVAERVVLERGPAIVNVSAVPADLGWTLKRETGGATGIALVHAGNVPGVASLVAADLLRAHPEADELELAFTISAGATSGRGGAGLMHRYLTAARRHPTFSAELGPPMGTRMCFEIGPNERGWLAPDVLAGRTVRLGIYFRERPLQALFRTLNGLHLMAGIPRVTFVAGRRRPPDVASKEPIAEWVAVNRAGERLAARAILGRGDYRVTSAATVAFGEALVELRATQPSRGGVFSPEELFELSQLGPGFERRGISVEAR